MPRLTFPGAARTVTGSPYLLDSGGARLHVPGPGESIELPAGAAA
jgi:hypothetical protein